MRGVAPVQSRSRRGQIRHRAEIGYVTARAEEMDQIGKTYVAMAGRQSSDAGQGWGKTRLRDNRPPSANITSARKVNAAGTRAPA
jgi:hypothetical protein